MRVGPREHQEDREEGDRHEEVEADLGFQRGVRHDEQDSFGLHGELQENGGVSDVQLVEGEVDRGRPVLEVGLKVNECSGHPVGIGPAGDCEGGVAAVEEEVVGDVELAEEGHRGSEGEGEDSLV